MSPPIRDGSGNSIGSIRLGDGSEISEVRTGAGDVLFSAIPDSGVMRLTFDNADTSGSTAIDSFNNNDASINGATTGVAGANDTYTTNEAYSFDGNNDFVESNSPTFDESFYNSAHSVAGWINTTSSASSIIFGIFDSSTNDRERAINTGNLTINRFTTGVSGSTTIDDGNWHHVVYTYSGDGSGDMTGYVDGSQDVTATETGSFSAGTQDSIYIGANGLESQQFVSGDLDDIRVYDKELTSTEVNSLYNTGSIL